MSKHVLTVGEFNHERHKKKYHADTKIYLRIGGYIFPAISIGFEPNGEFMVIDGDDTGSNPEYDDSDNPRGTKAGYGYS